HDSYDNPNFLPLAPMRVGCLARRGTLIARREPMPQREDKNSQRTFQALPERLSVHDSTCAKWHSTYAIWHGSCSYLWVEEPGRCGECAGSFPCPVGISTAV